MSAAKVTIPRLSATALESRAKLYGSMIPHFSVGSQEVLFPKFQISMIKSHLPPNYARFIVPMTFNKLDLRDYLFHAYSVRTLHIRSSITQGKASKNNKGQLRREPSVKTMTVELTDPFVWPEDPWVKEGVKEEEWEGFDRKVKKQTDQADQDNNVALKYDRRMKSQGEEALPSRKERGTLAQQARRLLDGKEEWKSTREAMNLPEFWKREGTYGRSEGRKRV